MAGGTHPIAPAAQAGWSATLELGFGARDGATALRRRRHAGPLQVQRAFYPEGHGVCHVYVLHPPGGLVAGDELAIDVEVDAGAHALVTTPAAGKVYRSPAPDRAARQGQRLAVADGGALEWLPQETILFGGARARLVTQIELAGAARFVGWEIVVLGRPACDEPFGAGRLGQRIELYRDGEPLFVERTVLDGVDGGAAALAAPWGLQGRSTLGTFFAAPSAPGLLDALREVPHAGAEAGAFSALTELDGPGGGVLVARTLGDGAARARAWFAALWAAARPALLGRPASSPRIWTT
jgi:urease accessory protein